MSGHEEDLRGVLEVWRADFGFADGSALPLNLGVLLTRTGEGWRNAHYQVSAS